MTDCVPIEILNLILASTELPPHYRTNIHSVRARVLEDERVDYFSVFSAFLFFGQRLRFYRRD
jgi:hypothetical protein